MLVLRRATAARGLLLAATATALLATVMLTALALYAGAVLDAGIRSAVAAAPADERSLLVSGPAGRPGEIPGRVADVTDMFADGLAGAATTVTSAGYAVGQQLPDGIGETAAGGDGLTLADVMYLDRLADHTDLTAGTWPNPGATPTQVALPEAAATALGVSAGDRIPLTDRRTGKRREVAVTGVFRPRNTDDPYWRLAPGVFDGVRDGTATYGPFVVAEADFRAGFAASASLAWLVQPDLRDKDLTDLAAVAAAATSRGARATEVVGGSGAGQAQTSIDALSSRLQRTSLSARSALLTPMLLLGVISGYALLLVAGLLTQHRRGETALLRARGASRRQLAGMAAGEALFVVLPAAAAAPFLASQLLAGGHRMVPGLHLPPHLPAGVLGWTVAAGAAVGCALALTLPAARRGGSYVAEQQARSRPARRAALQRAGGDVALVVLAVVAWLQLRQYAAPVLTTGDSLGVDPVLVVAPTLGVLAAVVVALRLLPLLTRAVERIAARRAAFATALGSWQAGRRPHAGPVLLLSLAVGVATLALSLESTSRQSQVDQADHEAGADLRIVEVSRPGAQRPAQLAKVPGVRAVVPAIRESAEVGEEQVTLVALPATSTAAQVVRLREDLAPMPVADLLRRLGSTDGRKPVNPLPGGATVLTGTVRVDVRLAPGDKVFPAQVAVVLRDQHGQLRRVVLNDELPAGRPVPFRVELPAGSHHSYDFVGVDAAVPFTSSVSGTEAQATIAGLRVVTAGGETRPVRLAASGGAWHELSTSRNVSRSSDPPEVTLPAGPAGGELRVSQFLPPPLPGAGPGRVAATVLPPLPDATPAAVTPAVLRAAGATVGDRVTIDTSAGPIQVEIVAVVDAVPGVTDPRGLLLDLAVVTAANYLGTGVPRSTDEWWLSTTPGTHAKAAAAAAELSGVTVFDRKARAQRLTTDVFSRGAQAALLAAVLAAALLAALGVAVDARTTARARAGEMAVLHTMGTSPRTLARALVVEQALLAGLGVVTGVIVGLVVASAMGPLLILTPNATRPVPDPRFTVEPLWIAAPAVGLLAVALALGALVAYATRRTVVTALLRLGEER